jgi:hypothetical protein
MRKLASLCLIFLTTITVNLPQVPSAVADVASASTIEHAHSDSNTSLPDESCPDAEDDVAQYPTLLEDLMHDSLTQFFFRSPVTERNVVADDRKLDSIPPGSLPRPPDFS